MFSEVENHYWDDPSHQGQFLDHFMAKEGLETMEGWYGVSMPRVREAGGSTLLSRYSNSLANALEAVYPKHDWQAWKFSRVPRGYWSEVKNRKKFFLWVAQRLGLDPTNLAGFYEFSSEDVAEAAGHAGIFDKYSKSLPNALADSFPEHEWQEWKFRQVPQKYWHQRANVRRFCDFVLKTKGADTNRVDLLTLEDIYAQGGGSMVERHFGNSVQRVIAEVYPEFQGGIR